MRIAVIEDEQAIREVEAAYLRRAGFEVAEYADGPSALRGLSTPADLFVLDINLPGMDGLEVCRRLRQHSLAPIILVTAKTADADELAGLEAGADDYLRKPFNPEVLVARAGALLRRHGQVAITLGPLAIDPETQTVRKEVADIPLTAIQFRMLYLFAQTPGRVYSRSEIVDRAWGDPFDCDVLERTVDAHVKRIRRLVEDDPTEPKLLLTVIGRGYKAADHA